MFRFFQFLYKFRSFLLFVILEVICFALIYQVNHYHGTQFFHSANALVSSAMSTSQSVSDFFSLAETNERLAIENARLKEQLEQKDLMLYMLKGKGFEDLFRVNPFEITEAKIVNNTIYNLNNFITIDKGVKDGVMPGMALIGNDGVVGIIRNSTQEFSVAYSLLNSNVTISARLGKTGELATVRWDGEDYRFASLDFLPRHIKLNEGDTIYTSGFNSVFPEDIMIGTVEEYSIPDEDIFYKVRIRLSTDFGKLRYVYIVENRKTVEIDSVQQINLER